MLKMPYERSKRFFDVIFSTVFLLLFSPIYIIMCLAIFLEDKGEIFVKDPLRLGRGGKEFRMYKFRTMIPNAHEEILHNPKYKDIKKKWENNGNKLGISEDPRITKVGKILRKTDLDEIPQFLNVLKGDMSVIGPRPSYEGEIEKHIKKNPEDEKYVKTISSVRPGITGIWQVSGRNSIDFSTRLKMDSEYVKNTNLLEDKKILLKTPYVILTRKGVYE